MEKFRLRLAIFTIVAILNCIIDYGICKQFRRMGSEPGQSIDETESTTPHVDYQDVDFEGQRDSSWSGTNDPDPDIEVDQIRCEKPGEWDNLAFEESIKFKLDQKNCELNILGSKAEKCSAEIVCTNLNFKGPKNNKCQPDSYLKITDALGGSMTACGSGNFGGPFRASRNGRDLYIKYAGPSVGTVCQVVCGQDRQIPQYTPLLNVRHKKREKTCHCGIKPEIQGRVVGGKDAQRFEFPWLAAIAYKSTRMQFCGGSLINDRFILTAAHCFHANGIIPDDIDILLHAHVLDLNLNDHYEEGAKAGEPGSILDVPGLNEKNYTDTDEETLRLEVESINIHPLWNSQTLDYDICLLKLKKPLDLKDTRLFNPVCLPPEGKYFGYANKTATVAGWGKPTEYAGAASRILQKAKMPVLFSKKCRRMFDPESRNMTPRMFCAGHVQGGIDSCGDSGGPLTFKFNDDQYRQIGIVSFGVGCARPANPGVYTNVQDAIWCENLLNPPPTDDVTTPDPGTDDTTTYPDTDDTTTDPTDLEFVPTEPTDSPITQETLAAGDDLLEDTATEPTDSPITTEIPLEEE